MGKHSDFNDKDLKEKFKILLNEDTQIRKWNEGILIKSLILIPIIIFIIGLFLVNSPGNLTELLIIFLYPLALIFIALVILFVMRSNLK